MAGALFAHGRLNERDLTSILAAGSNQVPVANADTYFAAGDPIFVSESDGSEVEFLGVATSVTTGQIVTTFATGQPKAATGKAWKPQSTLAVAGTFGTPEKRKLDRGLIVQRSLAGTTFSMDVGASAERFEIDLSGLTPRELDSLLSWIESTTAGGTGAFTIVHLDRRVEAVRLTGAPEAITRASGGRGAAQLPVLSEGRATFA